MQTTNQVPAASNVQRPIEQTTNKPIEHMQTNVQTTNKVPNGTQLL